MLHRTARLSALLPGETAGPINQQWVEHSRGRDVALKSYKETLHAFMKPSQLRHPCTDNYITGDVDLKLGSISHYWNAKNIFC